jgi:pantoate--beta-alanine ligase
MSSRNAYLDPSERVAARVLSTALRAAADAAVDGERRAAVLEALVRERVGSEPKVALEYAEVRDARTLEPRADIEGDVVLALAAAVGRARLIDNVVLSVDGSRADVDLGVRVGEHGTLPVP